MLLCGLTALGNQAPTSPRLVHSPMIAHHLGGQQPLLEVTFKNASSLVQRWLADAPAVAALTLVKLLLIKSLSRRLSEGGEKLSKGVIKKREK